MSDKVEILMKIVISGNNAIPAECQLAIDPTDTLMSGFENGRFFQIKDFNFSAGLQDDQGGAGNGGAAGGGAAPSSGGADGTRRAGVVASTRPGAPYGSTRDAHALLRSGQGKVHGGAARQDNKPGKKDEDKPGKRGGSFAKWRRDPAGGAGGAHYPLEVEPITFTRFMDQASTSLFQALCDSQSLASASIVRRAVTGGNDAKAYLRLDFTDVLIIGIDWNDDDPIEEKFKFICRGVKVQFCPQNSDGSLQPAVVGVWPVPKGK
jgi:type VI protein secretion system component Hcp